MMFIVHFSKMMCFCHRMTNEKLLESFLHSSENTCSPFKVIIGTNRSRVFTNKTLIILPSVLYPVFWCTLISNLESICVFFLFSWDRYETDCFWNLTWRFFNPLLWISHPVRYTCSNTNLIKPNIIILLEAITGFHWHWKKPENLQNKGRISSQGEIREF